MICQHCLADWCWLCGREIKGGGGGVTEHYAEGGPCAFQQFTWTADGGMGEPMPGNILLIYRCFGYEDPDELSPQFRLLCSFLNLILVVSIQGILSVLLLPFSIIFICVLSPCILVVLALDPDTE